MIMENEYTFQGPIKEVWELLLDPEVLKAVLPGTKKVEKISDTEYKSVMQMRLGPVNGTFNNTVTLSDVQSPSKYTMHIDAQSSLGFAKGTAHVTLEDQGEKTKMKYDMELDLGGRLASLGQRLLDTVGRNMAKQSLQAMSKMLEARLSGDEKAMEQASQAPSQAKMAVGLVKEIIKDKVTKNPNDEAPQETEKVPSAAPTAMDNYSVQEYQHLTRQLEQSVKDVRIREVATLIIVSYFFVKISSLLAQSTMLLWLPFAFSFLSFLQVSSICKQADMVYDYLVRWERNNNYQGWARHFHQNGTGHPVTKNLFCWMILLVVTFVIPFVLQ